MKFGRACQTRMNTIPASRSAPTNPSTRTLLGYFGEAFPDMGAVARLLAKAAKMHTVSNPAAERIGITSPSAPRFPKNALAATSKETAAPIAGPIPFRASTRSGSFVFAFSVRGDTDLLPRVQFGSDDGMAPVWTDGSKLGDMD